jgi:hypothetical protein
LREESERAPIIFRCTAANARWLDKEQMTGRTDLVIEKIYKGQAQLVAKKVVVIERYLAPQAMPQQFIVWADLYKNEVDVYRGVMATPPLIAYMEKLLEQPKQTAVKRLPFFFPYLDDDDGEVSQDALKEFTKSEYKVVAAAAKQISTAKVVAMMSKHPVNSEKLSVCALLLGNNGKKEHVGVFEKALAEQLRADKAYSLDKLLMGLTLLDADYGWKRIWNLSQDRDKDFLARYQALIAMRLLRAERPDLVSGEKAVQVLLQYLLQEDMADFAIEDLRKLQRWELTEPIVKLFNQKTHQVPVIQRSILRFALESTHPSGKKFVEEQRQRNAQWVEETEQLLKLQKETYEDQ